MRLAIVSVSVLATLPFAAAQTASDLERQYSGAETARETLMHEADAAVAAKSWSTVCLKGQQIVAKTNQMASLLEQLRDARVQRDQLEGVEYDNMSMGIIQLQREASELDQIAQEACAMADQ